MFPDVPRGCNEGEKQASGKNSTGLQSVDAENFRWVRRVVAPFVDDIQHLRPDDTAQDYQNAEIPGMVAVISQALGVAHTDPEA